jgi:hypothetical protein
MYGYELPKTEITIEIFGKETKITAQTYTLTSNKGKINLELRIC